VKYGSVERAVPSFYRELADDLDDEDVDDDEITINGEYYRHLDRPSDTIVHGHHVHEVHDYGMPVVDVEAAKISATATVALDNKELASSVTQRTSSGDEQLDSNSDLSLALKYNIEEGLATRYISFFFSVQGRI